MSELSIVNWNIVEISVNYDGQVIEHMAYLMKYGSFEHLLHWYNTTVKVFVDEEEDFYDHLEIITPNMTLALHIDEDLAEVTEDLIDFNYPYEFNPIPDEVTYKWAIEHHYNLGISSISDYLKDY